MKRSPFLSILVIFSIAMAGSKMAYTQSSIDSLWSLLQRSQPIQVNSPAWENAGKHVMNETCISGDCTNGYGISISNDRGFAGRYQYEGYFLRSKHHGVGIIKAANGTVRVSNFDNGKEAGAYLLENNGLMQLHNASGLGSPKLTKEFGFTLTDVQKHQANSFEKLTACTCLVRSTHFVEEEYQQTVDLTDELKNYRGTTKRTETQRVEYPGLRNNCKNVIYIKAISGEGGYYFDRSLVVLPDSTIMKRPFNVNYSPGKADVQYLGQYEATPGGIKN